MELHEWGTLCVVWPYAPVGHDPREGCVEMGAGTPCDRTDWGRRCSSLWGTILVSGVPTWARRHYANAPTGAICGAPYGGGERVKGCAEESVADAAEAAGMQGRKERMSRNERREEGVGRKGEGWGGVGEGEG